MKLILFILALAVFIPIQFAFAQTEIGDKYDKELLSVNPDGTRNIKWSSHYERIFDGVQWVNYQWTQDGNRIHFESASMIYDFDNCSFNLTDPDNPLRTATFTHTLTDGGVDLATTCSIESVTTTEDGLSINTKESDSKNELATEYNVTATGITEWTYEPKNIEFLTTKTLGIKDTCVDCVFEGTGLENNIIMNGVIVDTKDRVHNSLKEIIVGKNIDFIYEGQPLDFGEKAVIDPTATLTTSADNSPFDVDNDNVCEDTGSSSYTHFSDIQAYVGTAATSSSNDCFRAWTEFDISSITDGSTVTDEDFKININTVFSDITQNFYGMKTNQPSARTIAQAFDEIDDETLYVSSAGFTVALTTVDLTATADAELTTILSTSQNWFAIGARANDETLTASTRGMQWDSSSGATPPQLIVVYTEPTVPNSPTGLTALVSDPFNTKINLAWTTPSSCGTGCTGYKIWRESPIGGGFTVLTANTTTTATTYSDTGLTQNTEYNYKVAAWNHLGLGSNSTAAAEVTWDVPNLPTALKANTLTSAQIDLSWTTPSDNGDTVITGYKIWRESPTGGGFSVLVSNTTTTATTYSNTGLSAGTQYNYKTAAWNHIGLGANSTANANYTKTGSPTALTAEVSDPFDTKINLSWTAPSPVGSGITGYKIWRESPTGGGFSVLVSNTTTTATTYSNTGLTRNTEYNYKVAAYTHAGLGDNSTAAAEVTWDVPNLPTGFSATASSSTQINLAWTTPSDNGDTVITGYKIWRESPTGGGFSVLVSNTTTTATTYSNTGLTTLTQYNYKTAAWNHIGLGTNSTSDDATTLATGSGTSGTDVKNIGDTFLLNATAIMDSSSSNVTASNINFYRNATLIETKVLPYVEIFNGTSVAFDSYVVWYHDLAPGTIRNFTSIITVNDSSNTILLNDSGTVASAEYNSAYFPAVDNPLTFGNVNYTLERFDNEDGIQLKVNRIGGTLGTSWQIECITQTNAQALATRNQSLPWPGTWVNVTNTGYFNATWTGFQNTHGYVSCFNHHLLFGATTYTNSSLALFGVAAFDESFGSMLGVPIGIFFIVITASQANKRTAPTWIVVLMGIAGLMATVGFFTLTPIVWGVALVAAMLGLFVNQKLF